MENGVCDKDMKSYSRKQCLKFIIPSIIGVFLFLIPIKWDGNWTVVTGVLTTSLEVSLKNYSAFIVLAIFLFSLVAAVMTKILKPKFIIENTTLKELFDITPFGFLIRVLGLIFVVMVIWKLGPEAIWSEYTGGLALEFIEILMISFLVAGMLIPLLLDFGIMEFVGAVVRDIMKPLFTVPGRSTLDCLASWIGSGTVGIVITAIQYDEGYYTKREASVIATCFSVISIPFCLVFASAIGLSHMFLQMYITVSVSCFIAAIILPRISPLNKKKETYHEPVGKQINEDIPENVSKFTYGLDMAIKKADTNTSVKATIKKGVSNFIDVWISLMPLVMAVATLSLILAEYTTIFTTLAKPLVPLLNLLQIPEAEAAAPAFIVGFVDIFIPVVIGSSITSEFTRFVIVCLACSQLIFMTETGPIIMKSNMGLNFMDLLKIFVLRTVITAPIIVVIARFIFF